jgi:hypothetical protein
MVLILYSKHPNSKILGKYVIRHMWQMGNGLDNAATKVRRTLSVTKFHGQSNNGPNAIKLTKIGILALINSCNKFKYFTSYYKEKVVIE